jgi:hypothetical protein
LSAYDPKHSNPRDFSPPRPRFSRVISRSTAQTARARGSSTSMIALDEEFRLAQDADIDVPEQSLAMRLFGKRFK